MKRIQIKTLIATALMTLVLGGCNDNILDEQPRSIYEPGYFKTEKGTRLGFIPKTFTGLNK